MASQTFRVSMSHPQQKNSTLTPLCKHNWEENIWHFNHPRGTHQIFSHGESKNISKGYYRSIYHLGLLEEHFATTSKNPPWFLSCVGLEDLQYLLGRSCDRKYQNDYNLGHNRPRFNWHLLERSG